MKKHVFTMIILIAVMFTIAPNIVAIASSNSIPRQDIESEVSNTENENMGYIPYQEEPQEIIIQQIEETIVIEQNTMQSYTVGEEESIPGFTTPMVDTNGNIISGWNSIDGKKVYLDVGGFIVTGWFQDGEYWSYAKEDGSVVKGVTEIDGKNYYFNGNGRLGIGWKKLDGVYYFFNDASTYKECYELSYTDAGTLLGWVTLSDGRRSYLHPTKGLLTGSQTLSGKRYLFDAKGILKTNYWYRDGNYWSYATKDGSWAEGVTKIDGKSFYFNGNCRLGIGWKKIDGVYRFFNDVSSYEECYELSYTDVGTTLGWVTLSDGRRSYLHPTKGLLTGEQTLSGKNYLFDTKGILKTNYWYRDGNYWSYATKDGSWAKGITQIDGKNYYFNENGRLGIGWKKIDGTYHFFNDAMTYKECYELSYTDVGTSLGWVTLSDGRKCYIHPQKGVLTSWQIMTNKKYYFNGRGVMQSGWVTLNAKQYFFNYSGIYIPMDKPVIASVTSSTYGRAIVKWNEITGVNDYILQYSTNSDFTTSVTKTVTINDTTTNQCIINDLKANVIYYFRIKYTAQGGDKSNPDIASSTYSSAKNIKIKGEVEASATSATVATCQITSGTKDSGITVQFKATLKERLKSADDKYYIVQIKSYGTKLDVGTPRAEVEKSLDVSVKFYISDSSNADSKANVNRALMDKYALAIKLSNGSYQLVSSPKGITNPEAIAENTAAIFKASSKKGIQGVAYASDGSQPTDARYANSKQTLLNLDIADVVNPSSNYTNFTYKGKTYRFSKCSDLVANIKSLNAGYKQYVHGNKGTTKVAVSLCLLLSYDSANAYLIDPAARSAGHKYYTLNVREEKARETLEALFVYLGELFGQEDCYVTNWILGNEINSSKAWNYSGSLSFDTYMQCYTTAFRMLYNAVKSEKTGNTVSISLDNGWTAAPDTYVGKTTLDSFAKKINAENPNIEWSIAYHPYSHPLTRADFWNDASNTTNSTSTKYISMKNITVLTNYVGTLEKIYKMDTGSIRVLLTEQGYTFSAGAEKQAIAIARGYYIAEFNNRIDAFIIRAIVDDAEEAKGNLYFGLMNSQQDKRIAFYVYEYMDSNLTKLKSTSAASVVSSANYGKFNSAKNILCTTKWSSIVPGFNESKLNTMY